MENEKNKGTGKNIVIAILFVLLLVAGGYIGYDKILKREKDINDTANDCPKCQECESTTSSCNCPNNNVNFGEKISSFKEIKLTSENQLVKIGNSQFKVKIVPDSNVTSYTFGYLSIDDYLVPYPSEKVGITNAYLTDKYIIFTQLGQGGEMIKFVQGERNKIGINNNQYQMHDFKIVDGYLHATGDTISHLDNNWQDKDLLIKYIDNTLIVVPAID